VHRVARHANGISGGLLGSRSLTDLTVPPPQLRQLGEIDCHAAGLVTGQPVGRRAALGSRAGRSPYVRGFPFAAAFNTLFFVTADNTPLRIKGRLETR
jgi:hypothetical protein